MITPIKMELRYNSNRNCIHFIIGFLFLMTQQTFFIANIGAGRLSLKVKYPVLSITNIEDPITELLNSLKVCA